MPEPLTVTIGDTEVEVSPVDGNLEGGELVVSSISVTVNDDTYQTLDEPVEWNEDNIREAVRTAWLEKPGWPDTSDADWDEHRLVSPGTQKWLVIQYVAENFPVTSQDISRDLDEELNGNYQNVIYDAKEDNLVATIGYDEQYHVLAPTHLGLKELHLEDELEKTGIEALFSDNSPDEETEA